MRRGDLYRVKHPSSLDPRRHRVFVVVSRQLLLESSFSSVVCAPVYTRWDGLHSQVPVGVDQGLKHDSSVHCDELVSLPKSVLSDYLGCLSPEKLLELDRALAFALGLRAPLVN